MNFSYNLQDFWWNEEKLLCKTQKVNFRYFKIWIANVFVWTLFASFFIAFGIGVAIYNDQALNNCLIVLFVNLSAIFVSACIMTLIEIYEYKKS